MKAPMTHPSPIPKRILASASMDGTVQVWSLHGQATTLLSEWNEHAREVYTLAWSPDGTFLASGGRDAMVYVWQARSFAPAFLYTGHREAVYAVVWSPDGKMLASGGRDRTVQIWDAQTGEQLCCYRGHSSSITCLAWSPGSRLLASGGSDGVVQVWDTTIGASGPVVTHHRANPIYALAWSPGGDTLALAERGIVLIRPGTDPGEVERSLRHLCRPGAEDMYALVWSPDGTLLAGGGFRSEVKIWEVHSGRLVLCYLGHREYVRTLSWSPDGNLVASGSRDETVQVWEASSGRRLTCYQGHRRLVYAVAWSPERSWGHTPADLAAKPPGPARGKDRSRESDGSADAAIEGGTGTVEQKERRREPDGSTDAALSVFPPLYREVSTPDLSREEIPPPGGAPSPDQHGAHPLPEPGATVAARVPPKATGAAQNEALRKAAPGMREPSPPASSRWLPCILFLLSPPGLVLLLVLLTLASFVINVLLLLLASLSRVPPFFLHLLFG